MSNRNPMVSPPLLRHKAYADPSAFTPENLLREARRQKKLPLGSVPDVCILDPDGDIVRNLRVSGQARRNPYWACYHTELYDFVCFAHVTNQMATVEGDFEKGEAEGSLGALQVIAAAANAWARAAAQDRNGKS